MPTNEPHFSHQQVVDSPANPLIKHLRSLTHKKNREITQSFFTEGLQAALLALEVGADVQMVFYAPPLFTGATASHFLNRCQRENRPLIRLSERAFRSLSKLSQPSGVGLLARQRYWTLRDLPVSGPVHLLALEGIQYAGNLGTILRTCDAAGLDGVILLDGSVDPYGPEAVKASMGCIFTQRLIRASASELLSFCEQQSLELLAATPEANAQVKDLKPPERWVLLLGSERQGLSPALRSAVTTQVSIPMHGKADSLNIAVAAGILIYQLLEGRAQLPLSSGTPPH